MRILHVTTPAPYGGLERVVTHLAASQSAAGEDVHVATLTTEAGTAPFLERLAAQGVMTHAGRAGPRDYLRQRRQIAALGRGLRADVVHTHGYRADVLAAATCRDGGTATVSTLHGFTGGGWKNRCYEWLQRRAVRSCDMVVAVSGLIAERLEGAGVPAERIRVIPNSVPVAASRPTRAEARALLGLPRDPWVVGWVGRLSTEKGLDLLLEAMARLDLPDLHLAVVGDGVERIPLMHLARSLGLTPRITWCGAVPSADRVLPAFDLLALSSRTEGSPLVVLEAMAVGTPILATTVGGVPEILSPATAILVPPEDADALAVGIRQARQDRGASARRVKRAHIRFASVSAPGHWLERYEETYRDAVIHRVLPA